MIDTSSWREFTLDDLFDIKSPSARSEKSYEAGEVDYVSSGAFNNGIANHLQPKDGEELDKGHCITVSPLDGSSFWQEEDFMGRGGSGASISMLYNDNLNDLRALFICSVIRNTARKFGYSDLLNSKNLRTLNLKLPATSDSQPNWDYMESYMKTVMEESEKSLENLKRADSAKHPIDVSGWGEFDVSDFFTVLSGRNKLSNVDIDGGDTPVYSSNSFNGGIFGYTTKEPDYIVDKTNPFYVTFGDHTKAVNIADKSFCVMDNVKVLTTEIHNYNILHFIITSWLRNIPDLGYARHWSIAETSKIHLPITVDGEPDWRYMEDYMKRQFNEAELAVSQLQLAV